MQHLVFVYGTLRRGESNHHFLSAAQFLGLHETAAEYAMYDLGAYPAVISGHQSIFGEVYLIDNEILNSLDRLEDVPVEYRRELINTPFGDAWIYIFQDEKKLNSIISSGNWDLRL
ncbi:gamma-glutamylcyclotransferase [Vibrio ponticus]|uniref:Gamma-glutamylcyclotransferase family protein n=1 Tax=Vibrio ponticus TaxID=265668 RepID=A0ABX3FJC2_9VIBR|nr:gamma-glutamylcyclotransferase [Vibrio ponticus]OLQ92064.1 gamma-glutamylcyclotransferase [Vibrio ponticus]